MPISLPRLFVQCRNTIASRLNRRCFATNQELSEIKAWLRQFSAGSVTLKQIGDEIMCIEWAHERTRNAFTGSMVADLDDVLCELEANCPKGVILRGANSHFSSGSDLNFVEKIANHEDGLRFSKFMQHLTSRVTLLPAISVALLEGAALGGGAELAMCADFRIGLPNSLIGFKQARMGLTTAWGGGARLVSVVGRETAMRLLLSGEDTVAEDALRLRLIDHIIPGERLPGGGGRVTVDNPLDESVKWLERLTGKLSIEVVHAIKKVIQQASYRQVGPALESELAVLQSLWGEQSHLNALAARRNQRPPGNR